MYKSLYQFYYYISERIDKKYIVYIGIALIILIIMNFSTIVWWGILLGLVYYVYTMRKQQLANNETKLEEMCRKQPELDVCRAYNQSKKAHKTIVETIESRVFSTQ
jgi:hypothetical protein